MRQKKLTHTETSEMGHTCSRAADDSPQVPEMPQQDPADSDGGSGYEADDEASSSRSVTPHVKPRPRKDLRADGNT